MRNFDNPFKAIGNLFSGGPDTETITREIVREPKPREEEKSDRKAQEEAARKQRAALAQRKGSASTLLTTPGNGSGQGSRQSLLGSSS